MLFERTFREATGIRTFTFSQPWFTTNLDEIEYRLSLGFSTQHNPSRDQHPNHCHFEMLLFLLGEGWLYTQPMRYHTLPCL
jgi:hypothetical protein